MLAHEFEEFRRYARAAYGASVSKGLESVLETDILPGLVEYGPVFLVYLDRSMGGAIAQLRATERLAALRREKMAVTTCAYCGKATWKTTKFVTRGDSKEAYHPCCYEKRAAVPPPRAAPVPVRQAQVSAPVSFGVQYGANFLIIASVVLFIGISLVLANAVRERPVYTLGETVLPPTMPVAVPPHVPTVLPALVTVTW